jgi:hypothetical protein
VAKAAEATAAAAAVAAKIMAVLQTTAAAHAKAAAAAAAVVAAVVAAETPPSVRVKFSQIATNGYYISLRSVSPWKQTKTNAPRDGRQSLQLDRGRGCKKVATQIYKNGIVKTNRNDLLNIVPLCNYWIPLASQVKVLDPDHLLSIHSNAPRHVTFALSPNHIDRDSTEYQWGQCGCPLTNTLYIPLNPSYTSTR